MRQIRSFGLVLAICGLLAPQAALARTQLAKSQPPAGGAVSKPLGLELTFTEDVSAKPLLISLTMTGMPGMANHNPMPIKGFAVDKKGPVATLRFPRALPLGSYRLDWTIAGAADQASEGSLTFNVK